MKYVSRFALLLKRAGVLLLTVVIILLAWDLYITLFSNLWYRQHIAASIVILWVFSAYFVLPRVHRFLSKIYIPAYFVGRARTADGLLGDPVNLAVNGSKKALIEAMEAAGWQQADARTLKTSWRIAYSSIFHRPYPNAPVSDLYVFGEKQDLAFQIEVDGNPRKRHHVRFWRAPRKWYMPGGYKVDWVGAATYDDAVGFSLFTMQVTHAIDANVDKERNFLIATLQKANMLRSSTRIEHFFNAYKTRNGGGHRFITDGSMVIADLLDESAARAEDSMEHANLDSIQQEIYNLARATAAPLDKKDTDMLIQRIEAELEGLRMAHNTHRTTKKVASEAVDILIQSVQLIAALGHDTSEVYRDKMDANCQQQTKERK